MKSFIILTAITAALTISQAQVSFTKITTGPVATDAFGAVGTTWVDFDGDGDLDLYVSNSDGANQLYVNDGKGGFTPTTLGAILEAGPGSYSASWADVDNDGRIDLFIGRMPGPGLLFRQASDGTFAKSTLGSADAFGAAWVDYDLDGWVDLLATYQTSNIRWHNNGQGGLTSISSAPIDVSGDAVAWADYDGDGDPDVFVAESPFSGGGGSRLYRNDGKGAFTRITTGQLVERSSLGTGVAWGDYDNDGFPDLFLTRGTDDQSVPSFLFHNNGDGTFTQIEQSPFTEDTGVALSCSWVDFDNDGWLDLFVTESNGTVNRLYHNSGDGTFTRVSSGPIASDVGSCLGNTWGDYDRDGFLDLFVSVSDSPNYLYHNDGNSNAWITIKCAGTRSNRSAIGAKVRVKAIIGGKSFWQQREIHPGDGWAGVPLEAHFGLGNATHIEVLRVEWPSGTVQEFQQVEAKRVLTVTEPSLWSSAQSNGIPQFSLQGGRNLTYQLQSSTNFTDWSLLGTVTITNVSGSIVITDTNAPISNRRFYRAVSPVNALP